MGNLKTICIENTCNNVKEYKYTNIIDEGLTFANDWTYETLYMATWGGCVMINGILQYAKSISVPASGNFDDIVVGTLEEKYRPQHSTVAMCNNFFGIATFLAKWDGELYLSAVSGRGSTYTIPANTKFSIMGTWIRKESFLYD